MRERTAAQNGMDSVLCKESDKMFAAGDLVVYGGEGVCRVESIGPSGLAYDDGTRLYYHLAPLYRSGTVMTPVDTGVLMRSVITREEALALIASIPSLPPCKPEQPGIRAAKDFYHQVVMRCQCGELAAMIHNVCRKRAWALRHGKKVSQMDERYLKRAEDQLYGELAAVLGLERGGVADLIRQSWPGWPEKLPEPAPTEA